MKTTVLFATKHGVAQEIAERIANSKIDEFVREMAR